MAKENLKFLGPYERYKLIKPYIQAEEEKSKANKGAENSTSQDQQEDKIALVSCSWMYRISFYSNTFKQFIGV